MFCGVMQQLWSLLQRGLDYVRPLLHNSCKQYQKIGTATVAIIMAGMMVIAVAMPMATQTVVVIGNN